MCGHRTMALWAGPQALQGVGEGPRCDTCRGQIEAGREPLGISADSLRGWLSQVPETSLPVLTRCAEF